MPRTQTETHIRNAVRGALRAEGWLVFYLMQGMGCYPGLADLHALKNGRSIWLEIKTEAGTQRPEQKRFQADIGRHGGEYRVVRDLRDVADLLGQGMMIV